jgi:hypothetical protein
LLLFYIHATIVLRAIDLKEIMKYQPVKIEGFSYQLTYLSTWEFGYSVDGQRCHCDRTSSINTAWRYLDDSAARMYDALAVLLLNN